MKIAIDCRFLGMSGIGTFIENVLNELLTAHTEHDYLLICRDNDDISNNIKNVESLKAISNPLSIKDILWFPSKEINACSVFYTPYINVPAGIKIPVFTTIHDMLFFDRPELFSAFQRCSRWLYLKRTIAKSSAIFTVSQFSKSRIEYLFGKKKPVCVLGNSISEKLKRYRQESVPREDTIVFVGNIKEHKGLKQLLQAFSELRKEGSKTKLVIIGESRNFRTKDKTTLTLLDSQEGVLFTGYLPDEDLYNTVAKARLLVMPSLYEGFGIPALEALYLGTNVLLSDIPVFKEIYSDLPVRFFESGNYIDLKQKLMVDYPNLNVSEVRYMIDSQYSISTQVDYLLSRFEERIKR